MGVPMRRVDCNYMTLHYCTHLGGLLKLGTNYRQCRHAGEANSMQYLVLLPGLALADRSKLFIQSRAHVTCKDGARAERYPKRYPNDKRDPNHSQSALGDQLSSHKTGRTGGGCW